MIQDEKIGQLLLREGVITESQLREALEVQTQSYGKSLGEILLNLKSIEEADFLRILAKQFQTQYLTTKKLTEIKVPEAVLKMVPVTTAEKHSLFPVQYKKADKSLTLVMTNPQDVSSIDEVKFVSGINNIKTLVGMEDSVKAAIDKWYKGDDEAFNKLMGDDLGGYDYGDGGPAASGSRIEDEDEALDLSRLVAGADGGDEPAPAPQSPPADDDGPLDLGTGDNELFLGGMSHMPGDDNLSREQVLIEEVADAGEEEVEEVMVAPVSAASVPEEAEEAKPQRRTDAKKYRMRMLVVENHESIQKFIVKLFSHEGFKVKGVESRDAAVKELEEGEYDSVVIKDRDLGEGEEFASLMAERFAGVELCSIKDYGSAVIGETRAQKRLMSSFLETLDILVGLLEISGAGMQGHSHNVGKYARLIAGKLDLLQKEIDTIALAGYVHDLGKKGMTHYTVINIDENTNVDDLMEQAEIPLKLLSSAKHQHDIGPIVRGQYERWDGSGAPQGQKGEDIPVGARILALVEAFDDLTNKYTGKDALEPTAALEIIRQHAGALFDPGLVDLLMGVVRDDIYLQQMSGTQDRILIADTEADQITLMELRLVNMGFAVSSARTAQEALDKARANPPALILTEADFPDFSGFELIEKIKADAATRDVPFLFIAKKDDSKSVNRGFRLGAEDYMIKPVRTEILAAKINNIMSRLRTEKKAAPAGSGVSGSLSEMSLPDIIQILGAGRKTGRITLEDQGRTCAIDMDEGQVINASVDDLKGEDAFYKILYWNSGSFTIDPAAAITEKLITLSIDSLMLEGYRRMDEESNTGGSSPEDIALDGSDFF